MDYLELLKDRKFHVHAIPVSIEFAIKIHEIVN